jgi:hypothetical protein
MAVDDSKYFSINPIYHPHPNTANIMTAARVPESSGPIMLETISFGVVRCYQYNQEKNRPFWSETSPRPKKCVVNEEDIVQTLVNKVLEKV